MGYDLKLEDGRWTISEVKRTFIAGFESKGHAEFFLEMLAGDDPDAKVAPSVVRDLRGRAGLSQRQAAELIGVPQPYVSKYERTGRGLSSEIAQALVDAMAPLANGHA